MREIVFDTETTGFDPKEHRVLEIGCVEIVNRLPTGRVFHHYLNPEREIDWQAARVHGITADKVAGAPKFADIAQAFLEFVGDSPLVAHNASFDMGFMAMELERASCPPLTNIVVDTVALARQKLPGQRVGLDALCRLYNIDLSARTLHGALLDAQLLVEVYIELTGGLQGSLLGSSLSAHGAQADMGRAVQSVQLHTPTRPAGDLGVVEPTAAEREAHQAFLQAQVPAALWNAKQTEVNQ
jgi:DNA polymerase III subunit epsilon